MLFWLKTGGAIGRLKNRSYSSPFPQGSSWPDQQKKMKKLLLSITKDQLDISYFSGTGAGGQHRNRHMNCVRIRHPDSGVLVTAQEERSLGQNKRMALKRLAEHPKFRAWLSGQISRIEKGEEIEAAVDKAMRPENLLIETLAGNGKSKSSQWIPILDSEK